MAGSPPPGGLAVRLSAAEVALATSSRNTVPGTGTVTAATRTTSPAERPVSSVTSPRVTLPDAVGPGLGRGPHPGVAGALGHAPDPAAAAGLAAGPHVTTPGAAEASTPSRRVTGSATSAVSTTSHGGPAVSVVTSLVQAAAGAVAVEVATVEVATEEVATEEVMVVAEEEEEAEREEITYARETGSAEAATNIITQAEPSASVVKNANRPSGFNHVDSSFKNSLFVWDLLRIPSFLGCLTYRCVSCVGI